MSQHTHILVVDDEVEIREMLAEYLSKQGFVTHTAADGAAMRAAIAEQQMDLVVLDLCLPGEDGLSLARFLRERYTIGILMLTAADEVIDRIVGLEVGADDYLTKPFDPRELVARIKSVLRRVTSVSHPDEANGDTALDSVSIGRCLLNLEAHTLSTLEGQQVPLTSMEFDLLQAFATHPNRALSRDQLLDLAHQRDWEPFDRSIDIRVARLRRKVEVDPAKPQAIKTVRGVGYIFVPSCTV